MDSGQQERTRTTATTVAAPTPPVPGPRRAPAVESADTGPMAPVPAGPPPAVAPPAPAPATNPCRCGHDREVHEHFRRGTDCATCDCARFRGPGPLARLRG